MKLIIDADEVRRIAGFSDINLIDDESLNSLIEAAQEIAKQDIFGYSFMEMPRGNPYTGVYFNGNNTKFVTHHYPLADADFDGQIGSNDISGFWVDTTANVYDASISIENEDLGIINVTQTDGSPLPPNCYKLLVSYWYKSPHFDESLFKKAIAYLAADMAIKRLPEPSKITVEDIENKKKKAKPDFASLYEMIKERIAVMEISQEERETYIPPQYRGIQIR